MGIVFGLGMFFILLIPYIMCIILATIIIGVISTNKIKSKTNGK